MEALIGVPDRKTLRGRTEYALLLFLYKTGARVSEAAQLKLSDLHVGRSDSGHALLTLHGKGNKRRQCPLWPRTERVLAPLVDGRAASDTVFLSRYKKSFTRLGVYRLVERCALRVPALAGRETPPHVIRHSTACSLLRVGVDLKSRRRSLHCRGLAFAPAGRPARRSVSRRTLSRVRRRTRDRGFAGLGRTGS